MSTPFLGEIKIVAFNFAPRGWAQCDGQLLPINQNQALFALLGTMYGGDGRVNFQLPDFRGRIPTHVGGGLVQGQKSGEEVHTLSLPEMPQHTHTGMVQPQNATVATPNNNVLASVPSFAYRANPTNLTSLTPESVTSVGGNQGHQNVMPSLALNFCIAFVGIFPSRN